MKTTLEIQNLKCGGCANTISTKLSELEFVDNVEINNNDNTVTFSYENEETLNIVKSLLAKLGYPEVGDKNALSTKAKSFVSCAIGRMNK
ncbi:heavy-metal-associated domain-containing protein [Seonamhaeicola sediminis]|uniref:Heavy-metal-associated domain-containing protein n=1 Tax=Seonamhaeicola sediminis TaxID=2528206 RepID=A0A562YE57_9FLAO|nr:heavy metal-associated domain-containing protein [Seonamhaeicola sediminis]TWO32606.1 heavy-metal-associated domain-containing protein [Seonamhaeicola sediminis]